MIIALTDFSAAAVNAVHYAAKLAQQQSLPLHLVHAYILPVTIAPDMSMPIMPLEDMSEEMETRLKEAAEQLRNEFTELNITASIRYGDVTDALEEIAEEQQAVLAVIGNRGHGEDDAWMGSIAGDILRHAPLPVLAVPAGFTYAHLERICIAHDGNDSSLPAAITALAGRLGAKLELVHVVLPADGESAVTDFSQATGISWHEVPGASVSEGLHEYVSKNTVGTWLGVLPHHHSFFENLFHKSSTEAITRSATFPLLAVPAQRD